MALIICEECGKEFSDKAAACPNCGCPTQSKQTQQIVARDNGGQLVEDEAPRDEVIRHLRYAKEIETTLFALREANRRIEQKIASLGHGSNIKKPADLYYDFPGWGVFFISFAICLLLACAILEGSVLNVILILTIVPLIFGSSELLVDVGIALAGALAVTLVLGLIHVTKRRLAYGKKVKEYNDQVEADRKRVLHEKEQIKTLRNQQTAISKEILQNETLLKRLYALNIIFPKYRHMVAVITMLEYFESGRCSRLKGGHGAYDTYSYEEKQEVIIGKLDTVIRMLNDIRQTQYMLYEAIQDANATAGMIYAQSERMITSNNRIAENTALTAYNTEIIRRNTEISAYIDVVTW